MKKLISWLIAITSLSLNFVMGENVDVGYLTLTDQSKHAGVRSSRSILKMVRKDNNIHNIDCHIESNAKNVSWKATDGAINIYNDRPNYALWSGGTDATITAIPDGASAKNASIQIVDQQKTSLIGPIEKFDGLMKSIKSTESWFNKINGDGKSSSEAGLSFNVNGGIENSFVDFYNDGENIGSKIVCNLNAKLNIGEINAEIKVPLGASGLIASFGGGLKLNEFSAAVDYIYDESLANPLQKPLVGHLGFNAGVSLNGGIAIGVGVEDIISLTSTVSSGIKYTGDVEKIEKSIVITKQKLKISALMISAKLEYKMGVSFVIAETDDYNIIDGISEEYPNKTIISF